MRRCACRPSAAKLDEACGGASPRERIEIRPDDVARALQRLSTVPDGTPLTAVCLGTPHFSRAEWDRLLVVLGRSDRPAIPIYVNTDRATLGALEADGLLEDLTRSRVVVVADTCTYLTPILERLDGAVMTNSGKWAYYAPGNLGVAVAFGELEECVASAVAARVVRGAR
jgi:predicted aconitase